jgi:hypothetical protein
MNIVWRSTDLPSSKHFKRNMLKRFVCRVRVARFQ